MSLGTKMTRKHNKKPIIGKKGNLFWDEGANKKLINPTQKIGYKVKDLPPEYRNIKLSDQAVASKFAKGMPIVTDDYTSYIEGAVENGATAYIQHETVSTTNFEEYVIKWAGFLQDHTSATLKGYCWNVPLKGNVTKKPLKKGVILKYEVKKRKK